MSHHPSELTIPPSARNDAKAVELLRVWAAGGRQHVSIATGLWDDAASWGIMLVDLAKHIARAYEQTSGRNYHETLNRIKAGFDVEWHDETDSPTGELLP
jgi:hypothetical protein